MGGAYHIYILYIYLFIYHSLSLFVSLSFARPTKLRPDWGLRTRVASHRPEAARQAAVSAGSLARRSGDRLGEAMKIRPIYIASCRVTLQEMRLINVFICPAARCCRQLCPSGQICVPVFTKSLQPCFRALELHAERLNMRTCVPIPTSCRPPRPCFLATRAPTAGRSSATNPGRKGLRRARQVRLPWQDGACERSG